METYLYLFDDAVELTIVVDYDAVYQPAKVSGPPENCYPDESEMTLNGYTVLSIRELDDDHPPVTDEAIAAAWLAAEDRITDECWEHFHDHR